MKVVITDPAKDSLREIYRYFRLNGFAKTGQNIRLAVYKKAMLLQDNPYLGQEEENLEHLTQGHRRLVEGNYKIIYRVIEQTVFVTDIFDSRQDPEKINL